MTGEVLNGSAIVHHPSVASADRRSSATYVGGATLIFGGEYGYRNSGAIADLALLAAAHISRFEADPGITIPTSEVFLNLHSRVARAVENSRLAASEAIVVPLSSVCRESLDYIKELKHQLPPLHIKQILAAIRAGQRNLAEAEHEIAALELLRDNLFGLWPYESRGLALNPWGKITAHQIHRISRSAQAAAPAEATHAVPALDISYAEGSIVPTLNSTTHMMATGIKHPDGSFEVIATVPRY